MHAGIFDDKSKPIFYNALFTRLKRVCTYKKYSLGMFFINYKTNVHS